MYPSRNAASASCLNFKASFQASCRRTNCASAVADNSSMVARVSRRLRTVSGSSPLALGTDAGSALLPSTSNTSREK